jgi:predicted helicase
MSCTTALGKTDEAHRVSGRGSKPWAAIHDNARVPADRRLYMTATPRVWEAPETEEGGSGAPVLVASMEDDPNGLFGGVAYKLTLSQARNLGLVAACAGCSPSTTAPARPKPWRPECRP